MAVAAPARKAAPAPAAPKRKPRAVAVAPAPSAPTRKRKPAPRPAPARKRPAVRTAPARKAPVRKAPARGRHLIPIAVGTATAVRNLPDSGLIVRLTQGRAWIGLLGMLLAGIVALNVVTLSLAATAGQVDQNIQALDRENSLLRYRDAQKSAVARLRHEAGSLGLAIAAVDEVGYVTASPDDAATAARRLAAAGTAY